MEHKYYSPWDWQPIELMPNGCKEVVVRDDNGTVREMCSCDYWWLTKEEKIYTTFRFE